MFDLNKRCVFSRDAGGMRRFLENRKYTLDSLQAAVAPVILRRAKPFGFALLKSLLSPGLRRGQDDESNRGINRPEPIQKIIIDFYKIPFY
jgi:hypothetical protein